MLPVAYSPCPNDIFMFQAWALGKVGCKTPIEPNLADIETLNRWAREKKYPVSKISYSILGHLLDDYVLLPVGSALGFGNGPKIVAKKPFDLAELSTKSILLPGEATTAHLLIQLLCDQPKEKHFTPYHEILNKIDRGVADCGAIIHESRFTFQDMGLFEIADLGQLWEEKYQLPLPLGGVIAKRSLGNDALAQIKGLVKESLLFAQKNRDEILPYIYLYSQEMGRHVVTQHIDLYVNDESLELSDQAKKSIDTLLDAARSKQLIPPSDKEWLFSG